jgi:hypothetical protein
MSIFGIAPDTFSENITSEHFTNPQLSRLYKLFSTGNRVEPVRLPLFAEMVYEFEDWNSLYEDQRISSMFNDGLRYFFTFAWIFRMINEGNTDEEEALPMFSDNYTMAHMKTQLHEAGWIN